MDLPPEPDGQLIHERTYSVKTYRESPSSMRLRGIVSDLKPAGLYFQDDPEPLPVHHMVVDLVLDFPSLEITDVEVVMDVTPHQECTQIESTYDQLIGLSIARGFSRQVKTLFGGSLGCTHIGALLLAMAPAAVQSIWSMRMMNGREGVEVAIGGLAGSPSGPMTEEEQVEARRQAMVFNINTCHMWDENAEMTKRALAGEEMEPPVWAVERMTKLGVEPDEWAKF